jgi:transcriptional regulator with XRE-family HTH domain
MDNLREAESESGMLSIAHITHVGQRIRFFRELVGMNQDEMGEYLGKDRPWVSRMENNLLPDLRLFTLLRLQNRFGLSTLEDLLGPMPSSLRGAELPRAVKQTRRRRKPA